MTPYHPAWRTVAVRCKRLVESGFLDVLPMLYPTQMLLGSTHASRELFDHSRESGLGISDYTCDPELASLWQGVVDSILLGSPVEDCEAHVIRALTLGRCSSIHQVRSIATPASNLTED